MHKAQALTHCSCACSFLLMCVVPWVCVMCPNNRFPLSIPFVNGTAVPAYNDPTRGLDNLLDLEIVPSVDGTMGTWVNSSNYNYLQAQFNGSYDDITHIHIWAGYKTPTTDSNSGYLTVWLSSSANFSDTGLKCIEGLAVLQERSAYVICPQYTGARYVSGAACACMYGCTPQHQSI